MRRFFSAFILIRRRQTVARRANGVASVCRTSGLQETRKCASNGNPSRGDLRASGIYEQALTLNPWPTASPFPGPVKLIGADPTIGPASARANQALGVENGFDYTFVPGTGHMLQIEKPNECVREVLAFLGKHGLVQSL